MDQLLHVGAIRPPSCRESTSRLEHLKMRSLHRVPRSFHATFGAKWRRCHTWSHTGHVLPRALVAPHFRLKCVALTPSCRRYAYYLPPQSAGFVGEEERGGVRRRTGDSARSEIDDALRDVTAADLNAVLRPLAGVPRDFSALGRGLHKGKAVAERGFTCPRRRMWRSIMS